MRTEYEIHDFNDGLGKHLVIYSDWNQSFVKVLLRENISILLLSDANGWEDKDLTFLKNIPELRGISLNELFTSGLHDLTPLYYLPKLEYMGIYVDFKKELDLSRFQNLKILHVKWKSKISNLDKCINIEDLNINAFPYETLEPLSNLTKMRKLTIFSRKLTSTKGISWLNNLETLKFFYCPKLEDLSELSALKKLKELWFMSCHRIEDISELGGLENLQWLIFDKCRSLYDLSPLVNLLKLNHLGFGDCGVLGPIDFLKNLKDIKRLFFTGSNNIEDGDLSAILELPKLEVVGIVNRKHYHPSSDEIEKWVAAKKKD